MFCVISLFVDCLYIHLFMIVMWLYTCMFLVIKVFHAYVIQNFYRISRNITGAQIIEFIWFVIIISIVFLTSVLLSFVREFIIVIIIISRTQKKCCTETTNI